MQGPSAAVEIWVIRPRLSLVARTCKPSATHALLEMPITWANVLIVPSAKSPIGHCGVSLVIMHSAQDFTLLVRFCPREEGDAIFDPLLSIVSGKNFSLKRSQGTMPLLIWSAVLGPRCSCGWADYPVAHCFPISSACSESVKLLPVFVDCMFGRPHPEGIVNTTSRIRLTSFLPDMLIHQTSVRNICWPHHTQLLLSSTFGLHCIWSWPSAWLLLSSTLSWKSLISSRIFLN